MFQIDDIVKGGILGRPLRQTVESYGCVLSCGTETGVPSSCPELPVSAGCFSIVLGYRSFREGIRVPKCLYRTPSGQREKCGGTGLRYT